MRLTACLVSFLISHTPEEHATYYETTNQAFYDRKPAEVRTMHAADPLPEKGDDMRFVGELPSRALALNS
jgi:hypothetical protein